MQLKPAIRKATELGIGLTAISVLILAGCGGGASTDSRDTNTPTAAVKITTVTPGKGIMKGASVVIKDAGGNTVGSELTTDAGTAAVTLASTATGPLVVSVTCPATCTYFDEKTGAMVNGSASAPAMLAVVPSVAYLNIGVTVATNAAAQYAIAAGALTPTSVIAANNVVIAELGLTGVTDLLTPPTIISDSATQAAAQSGTSAADQLANYSAAIAVAASGVSALQAIADYGDAWKNAALVPASGVILPASIDAGLLGTAAPTFPATTIPNVTSQVAAATSAVAAAAATVSDWVAEVSVPGNSNGYWENSYYANAAAQASGVLTTDVHLWVDTVTVSSNTLTFSGSEKKLVANAWVTDTDPEINYHLGSAGWVSGANSGTVVNNLDGTITVTPAGMAPSVETVTRTDLSGTAIPCNNFYNTTCNGNALYPTGSIFTSSRETIPADHFQLTSGTTARPAKVTDMNGVMLPPSALPASFCVQQISGAAVFRPITPAPGSGDNYNQFGAMSCSVADIAAAGSSLGTARAGFTVTLSLKSTGNAAVTSVGLVTVTDPVSNISWMNNYIVAVRAGAWYPGKMQPAGTFGHMENNNKIAVNAELAANGRPAVP